MFDEAARLKAIIEVWPLDSEQREQLTSAAARMDPKRISEVAANLEAARAGATSFLVAAEDLVRGTVGTKQLWNEAVAEGDDQELRRLFRVVRRAVAIDVASSDIDRARTSEISTNYPSWLNILSTATLAGAAASSLAGVLFKWDVVLPLTANLASVVLVAALADWTVLRRQDTARLLKRLPDE